MEELPLDQFMDYLVYQMPDVNKHLSLMQELNKQRESGSFCDVTICCQDERFMAHRCILAASSVYLGVLFNTPMHTKEMVSLNMFSGQSLRFLLDIMYNNVQPVTNSIDILDVLKLADYIQAENIMERLINAVRKTINKTNFIAWYNVATECNLIRLIAIVQNFVCMNFEDLQKSVDVAIVGDLNTMKIEREFPVGDELLLLYSGERGHQTLCITDMKLGTSEIRTCGALTYKHFHEQEVILDYFMHNQRLYVAISNVVENTFFIVVFDPWSLHFNEEVATTSREHLMEKNRSISEHCSHIQFFENSFKRDDSTDIYFVANGGVESTIFIYKFVEFCLSDQYIILPKPKDCEGLTCFYSASHRCLVVFFRIDFYYCVNNELTELKKIKIETSEEIHYIFDSHMWELVDFRGHIYAFIFTEKQYQGFNIFVLKLRRRQHFPPEWILVTKTCIEGGIDLVFVHLDQAYLTFLEPSYDYYYDDLETEDFEYKREKYKYNTMYRFDLDKLEFIKTGVKIPSAYHRDFKAATINKHVIL